MAQKKMKEASALLQQFYRTAEEAGWEYGMIYLRVLQSLSAPNQELAVELISDALSMAHSERFFRIFIDQGDHLKPILKEVAQDGIFPEYVGEILSAFYNQPSSTVLPIGVETLSERELEVLHLLAAGMTNRQIADQLVVSISTVKSHVHHISSKLDAGNRTQAVARARELGLL